GRFAAAHNHLFTGKSAASGKLTFTPANCSRAWHFGRAPRPAAPAAQSPDSAFFGRCSVSQVVVGQYDTSKRLPARPLRICLTYAPVEPNLASSIGIWIAELEAAPTRRALAPVLSNLFTGLRQILCGIRAPSNAGWSFRERLQRKWRKYSVGTRSSSVAFCSMA